MKYYGNIPFNEFSEHVKNISIESWKLVFNFIQKFKKARETNVWYFEKDYKSLLDGDLEFSGSVISDFYQLIEAVGILIVYNWSSNDLGYQSYQNKDFDFSILNLTELSKILTFHVRTDRFNEDHFKFCVKNEVIEKILIAMQTRINSLELK